MTDFEVVTETDLASGQKTYSIALSPVPVDTPVGRAPGTARIRVSDAGEVVGVDLEVRPHVAVFKGALARLAAQAEWPVPVERLRRLGLGDQPVVHLRLKPDPTRQVGARVGSAADLEAVLAQTVVQTPENYSVETIETES